MKKLMTIATIALAGVAFAAGPNEQQRGPNAGIGRGPMGLEGAADPVVRMVTNPRMAEKIGLSEEQTAKIKEIDKQNRLDTANLRKKLRDASEKQAELLKAEKIDEAAVMAQIDQVFETRKEMAKAQTRRIIAIKAVLTPEQVTLALEEFRNRPKQGMRGQGAKGNGQGRGRGMRNGQGPEGEGPKGECKEGDCPPPPPSED